MAKIQLGDYGNRVAPAVPGARQDTRIHARRDGLADAAVRTSSALLADERAEVARAEREAAQEAKQRAGELRRAKGVEAYAGFQADLDELTDTLTGRLGRKEIKRDELPKLFATQLEEVKKRRTEGLDAEQQATVGAHFMSAERAARRALARAFDTDMREERVASINTTLENFQRIAVKDPAGAIKQAHQVLDAEGPGVIGADKVAGHKQAFAERAYFTHFSERLVTGRQDARQLQALEAEVAKNGDLDPDRKNVLLGRIAGARETLAAAGERAERSRLATLKAQIEATDSMILRGFEPNADQMGALLTAAKGTPFEPVVREQIAFARESAAFRAARPAQQEATLNELERQVRTRPTPELVQRVERMRSIHDAQQRAVKDDPISFAASRGLARVQPIDFSNPVTLGEQLSARLEVARGMKSQYGAPLQLLTREEGAQFLRFMAEASSESKVQSLSMLRESVNDREAYSVLMRQIAPDSPVTAVAGAILGKDRPQLLERNLFSPNVVAAPREVAGVILEGERLLNPLPGAKGQDGRTKGFPMPAEALFRQEFSDQVGRAFAADASGADTAYQAVRAYYAGIASREGDVSGELDPGRLKRALRAVTGGVTNFNGRGEVLLPWGMDEGEFKDAIGQRFRGAVKAAGLPDTVGDMLPALGLQQLGDGRYLVRSGTGYLLGKGGQPVEINLNEGVRSRSRVPGEPKGAKDVPL